jgi:deazaflavin-dependent oxidoreductase (nitroreductase family)
MSDIDDFNQGTIAEFRANDGKVGGPFEGAPLLLLHSTGAKSGLGRIHPVMYQTVEGGFAVFGSKGGAPENPAWYHNLLAHPDATVEVGAATIDVTARVAEGSEREQIWEAQKLAYPGFAEYEARTERTIPVVILTPR